MTSKSQQKQPLALKVVGFFIRFLTRVSPQLAASFVRYLWFKTHRSREPKREIHMLKQPHWHQFRDGNETIQVYIWGQENSPAILLVHGWNGRAAQLGKIAEELVKLGYRVIGFDAPAHGRSDGSSTNLPAISQTIQQLDKKYGPFTAGIAHSFGCLCLVHALNEGLEMEKVICISPVAFSGDSDHPFWFYSITRSSQRNELIVSL